MKIKLNKIFKLTGVNYIKYQLQNEETTSAIAKTNVLPLEMGSVLLQDALQNKSVCW